MWNLKSAEFPVFEPVFVSKNRKTLYLKGKFCSSSLQSTEKQENKHKRVRILFFSHTPKTEPLRGQKAIAYPSKMWNMIKTVNISEISHL